MNSSSNWSYHSIASGSDNVDYNFPFIEFSQETQRYLITYNDDDISAGDSWGTIWGKLYDIAGNVVFYPWLELSELLQKL